MSENYLITGYWGEPHVTSENDRGINAASFGTGRFVLPVGERFRAEYIGNNTIRMYDGKLLDNGAAAGIPVGEYVDLLITEAGQGMQRNDLIVFQYAQDASTLIESGTFVVLQGEETTGTAADPALTEEDLLSGTATFDQMALWRVSVSGTTISAPVQLFTVRSSNVENHNVDTTAHADIRAAIPTKTSQLTNDKGFLTEAVPMSGGTLNDGAKLVLSLYGTRFLHLTGNDILLDMSADSGVWATTFAAVKDATGKTTEAIGFYGSTAGLGYIWFGGSHSDPFMKMTPVGQVSFKSKPDVGGDSLATAGDITAAMSSHTQTASTITAGTFAGEVIANSPGQTYSTSLLRNSKLAASASAPSVNGEITWQYS